jgi:hypothetical protein
MSKIRRKATAELFKLNHLLSPPIHKQVTTLYTLNTRRLIGVKIKLSI